MVVENKIKVERIKVESPLESIIFNPVQGRNIDFESSIYKYKTH